MLHHIGVIRVPVDRHLGYAAAPECTHSALLPYDATLRNLATSVHQRGSGVVCIITASAKLCTPGVCASITEVMQKIQRT